MAKSKTPKVESFDQKTVKQILEACAEALRPVAEQFGVSLEAGTCRYSEDSMPVNFVMHLVQEGVSERNAGIAADYRRHADRFGLDPAWLNRDVEHPRFGGKAKIVGLSPRSRQPVIVEKPSGALYKWSVEDILSILAPADQTTKPGAGSVVLWKDEGEGGPAWLRDTERPGVNLRIESERGRARLVVTEVAKEGLGNKAASDGHLIGWISRSAAQTYARAIGASFEDA